MIVYDNNPIYFETIWRGHLFLSNNMGTAYIFILN